MDSKIYYGEYTLQHWMNLMLKGNIVLPDYQRSFVWDETRVQTLIDSLKNGEYVPPVSIGAYGDPDELKNLILDGQQRLTSVFLAYLGITPKRDRFGSVEPMWINDNDDEVEPEEGVSKIIDWTFHELTNLGRNKQEILATCDRAYYAEKDWGVDEVFFKTKSMGFTYLVPGSSIQEQQKYYSTAFRNINKQGKALLPQESRRSLYFFSQGYEKFFEPNFAKSIRIGQPSTATSMDCVRYLSLLFQYQKDGAVNKVARGYKLIMESYYENFISAVINNSATGMFVQFTDVFPDNRFEEPFNKLKEAIDTLDIPKNYTSIIDMDVYLFGLIYIILFEKKEIDIARKDQLKSSLVSLLSEFRENISHIKSPSALKYLRERMNQSILIYKNYCR